MLYLFYLYLSLLDLMVIIMSFCVAWSALNSSWTWRWVYVKQLNHHTSAK